MVAQHLEGVRGAIPLALEQIEVMLGVLEAAGRRLAKFGDRARLVRCDYGEPGWTSTLPAAVEFDAVVSGFSIHHQPDEAKRRIYAEIYDLLQPGGAFVNIEHVASATPAVARLNDETFLDSLFAFHQAQGDDRTRDDLAAEYYHRPDKSDNILALVESQCAWLRRIGFDDVDCYLKIFELAVFGGRKPK